MGSSLNTGLSYLAIVTVLILFQYIYFAMRAGMARDKDEKVVAPAMTGCEEFERKSRVHLNSLEQMAVTIPAMWLCGVFFMAHLAAALGLVYIAGRSIYSIGYLSAEVKNRATGMIITMLSNVVMLFCALYGAAINLL